MAPALGIRGAPEPREREKQQASALSGGEQQMLAIGRGLMALPKLMLLDEASLGRAPVMSKQIFDLVRWLCEEGLTLLLAGQDLHKSLAVASSAYVVENGRIAAEGSAQAIANDPRIRQAYLGL